MQTQTFDDCFSGCLECSDNIHKNYKKYIVYFFFFELVAFLVRGVKRLRNLGNYVQIGNRFFPKNEQFCNFFANHFYKLLLPTKC